MRRLAIAALLATGACASFEEPSIVIDLRVLAMQTLVLGGGCDLRDPALDDTSCFADQVIDVDISAPNPNDILNQLQDVYIRALVSDPSRDRRLEYAMTLCLPDDDDRCDLTLPHADLHFDILEDPDSAGPNWPDGTVQMDRNIGNGDVVLALLGEAVRRNPIDALGGVDLYVELRIWGEGEPETEVRAIKRLRIAPRIPITRTPNRVPTIDRLDGALGAVPFMPPQPGEDETRCQDRAVVESLSPGDSVTLFPVEPDGVREMYDAPALDGSAVPLDETITYYWFSTGGSWSDETTGGGRDILGNQSLLGSDWRAPENRGRYPIWMIQRDERLGVSWLETCIEVR